MLQATDKMICAALRGEDVCWPERNNAAFAETFLKRCEYHGVQALLNDFLRGRRGWPSFILEALHGQALALAMRELGHQQALTEALAVLAHVGIQPVVLKGTALAYSLYTRPAWRTRGDTDLIIRPEDRAQVANALASLGFKRNARIGGKFVSYQDSYTLETKASGTHELDVHWRINNSEVLSRLFSYDDVYSQAVTLPHLHNRALAAGPVHALQLACVHRAVHKQSPYYMDGVAHYSGDRLIWLYDIHLLANVLTRVEWQSFLELARQKGTCGTCLEGLERAHACFYTNYPEFVAASLVGSRMMQPLDKYLNAGGLRRLWLDYRAVAGISNRLRFVRELMFPSAEYMRSKYPQSLRHGLPWLYARHTAGGIIKRLFTSHRTQ